MLIFRRVKMLTGSGNRSHRGNRNVVFENVGSRTRSSATSVDDNVVDSNLQRKIDVVFDVLSRHLYTDWNSAGSVAHFGRNLAVVLGAV